MAEADAERQRHEGDREQRDGVRIGRADQAGSGADEPEDERRLVAKAVHDRPDGTALHHRAKHAERREEVAGLRHAEAEAARHEQRERRLENGEREPVDEVDPEHAAQAGPAQHLGEVAERHPRAGRRAVDSFRQPEPGHQRGHQRQRRRRPDGGGVAVGREYAAQRRPHDEAHAERGADETVSSRPVLRLGHISHVGARRRDVATRQPVDDAGEEEHGKRVRHRHHHEAHHRAEQAEDQHWPPAVPVRQVAEQRRRHELTQRVDREQQADGQRTRAERLGVER